MQNWEYYIFNEPEKKAYAEELNHFGKDGWELVSTVFDESGEVIKYIFKRPVIEGK